MAEHNATESQHGSLVLSISASTRGSTVAITAVLRNVGPRPWEYTIGGDLPPVLQIAVRDAKGNKLYGWQPPFASAYWRSIRSLEPGASITQTAEVTAQGVVYARAWVAQLEGFQTEEIEVVLPGPDANDEP